MNYSQAVKGKKKLPDATAAIQSQADTELSRRLSKEEEALLFSQFTPNVLLRQIQKVCMFTTLLLFNAKDNLLISMVMVF